MSLTYGNCQKVKIDSWRFVSVYVNGGGGNQWDLRGADATQDSVITYYSGIRPADQGDEGYYPMHKKGAILLGNGGDNGNGSAGTFYEGVMTQGYPTDKAVNAVQKNIAAQHYAEFPLAVSRITFFAPAETKTLAMTFKNTLAEDIENLNIAVNVPDGWSISLLSDIAASVAKDESITVTFTLQSPAGQASAGKLDIIASTGVGEYKLGANLRSAQPVKINEVRLSAGMNQKDQFIELYNPTDAAIDLSGWNIKLQRSGWAAVDAMTVPAGTEIASKSYLVLGLADNWLTVAAKAGQSEVYLGQPAAQGSKLEIAGAGYTVQTEGIAAGNLTTIFIPVSTAPFTQIEAGSSNIPMTSVSGFAAGQRMGIGLGENFEIVTVTEVGTAATQTNLAAESKVGDTQIQVDATRDLQPGSMLTISTGQRKELATVKSVIKVSSAPSARRFGPGAQPHEPGIVEIEQPLTIDHMSGVDISCLGTGITFEPALQYSHMSGEAVQPLGTPFVLDRALEADAPMLAAVKGEGTAFSGVADMLFGYQLSTSAGMVALYDGNVLADAIVYGSQQSNSSANGTIAQPAVAVMEGVQDGGGCIAIAPRGGFGGQGFGAPGQRTGVSARPAFKDNGKSLVRMPDGNDTDNLCRDFTTSSAPTPGTSNIE